MGSGDTPPGVIVNLRGFSFPGCPASAMYSNEYYYLPIFAIEKETI